MIHIKKKSFLLPTATLLISLFIYSCVKDKTDIGGNVGLINRATVKFENGTNFAHIDELEKTYGVKVLTITVNTVRANQEWMQAITLGPGQAVSESEKYLDDAFKNQNDNAGCAYQENPEIPEAQREELLKFCETMSNSIRTPYLVKKVTVEGDRNDIQLMESSETNLIVDFPDENIMQRLRILKETDTPEIISERNTPSWVPNSGPLIVAQNQGSSNRYVSSYMKWKTLPPPYSNHPFSGFSYPTYEHDFFLNNYNNDLGTYLSRQVNNPIERLPLYFSISSNLPDAYLDTRFYDPYTEVAYTIGCAKAELINRGTLYLNYMEFAPGDVNIDKGKLSAQRGHRNPSGCLTTWCSFGDEIVTILPAWQSIPGTFSWGM